MSKSVAIRGPAGLVPPRRTRPAFAVLALTVLALAAAVLSLAIGAAGALMQGHPRNPLADRGCAGSRVVRRWQW